MEPTSLSRSSQRKRTPRRRKEKPIDRLSELPEPLIAHILSFLDMKDAVRTSVLSKSWKYYWTQVDTIVFHFDDSDDSDDSEQRLEKFMLFVDHTLMQCTCPKIKKFSLTGCFNSYVEDFEYKLYTVREFSFSMDELVDKWIDFVLGKKVEVRNLGLKGFEYLIPECFYRSSSLTMLEIDEVGNHYKSPSPPYAYHVDVEFTSLVQLSFSPRPWFYHKRRFDVSWNKLQLLSLKSVYVAEEFMAEILFGCPVLETLILDKVGGLYTLNITSPTVTELRLLNCYMYDECHYIDLQINAPWVKKLEVSGEFFSFDCDLVCVPSLKSANLTLSYCDITHLDDYDYDADADDGGGHDIMSHNMIDKLLIPVCDADELVIGAELLQAVSVFHLIEETSLVLQYKSLTIQSPICIHEVPGIVCLLDSSSNMETLVMRVMPWQCDLSRYEGFKYGHYIKEVFTSFDAVDYLGEQKLKFPSLRNLKIDCRENLDACDKNECFELEIVAYIIKHSPFLEKVAILCAESNSSKCVAEYCSILTSKLKVGEKAVQWELKKMDTTYEFIFQKNN